MLVLQNDCAAEHTSSDPPLLHDVIYIEVREVNKFGEEEISRNTNLISTASRLSP